MPLSITALYAVLLTIVWAALLIGVGPMRGKLNIALGDGGNPALLLAIRRHGNFIETAPFLLLLLAIVEINGAGKTWLHVIGLLLLAGRILHPIGLNAENPTAPLRAIGMTATVASALISAGYLAWRVVLS